MGFYLALAGVCVAQSVFEKDAWLAERGVNFPWPVAGLPSAIHVDNAGEFHSTAFTRALEDFGVAVIYRPIIADLLLLNLDTSRYDRRTENAHAHPSPAIVPLI